MTIRIRSYEPEPGHEKEMAEEQDLFADNLSLILEHEQTILNVCEYFFCPLSFAWCSILWVGGSGPFCLGHLLLGWESNILVDKCSKCGRRLLITCFGGSALSGCNGFSGICIACEVWQHERGAGHFRERMTFAVNIRKQFPQQIYYWETYEGFNFRWGGNGMDPATKCRLAVKPVVEAVNLAALVQELASGQIRTGKPPYSVPYSGGLDFEMRFKNGGRITARGK